MSREGTSCAGKNWGKKREGNDRKVLEYDEHGRTTFWRLLEVRVMYGAKEGEGVWEEEAVERRIKVSAPGNEGKENAP
jgi:hypothetical protein